MDAKYHQEQPGQSSIEDFVDDDIVEQAEMTDNRRREYNARREELGTDED